MQNIAKGRYFNLGKGLMIVIIFIGCNLFTKSGNAQVRVTTSFDKDWKFYKGDATGAENTSFNDKEWRTLQVPHDWSIEGPYDQKNTTGRGGGYLPAGIGWYRKTFSVDENQKQKLHFIERGCYTNLSIPAFCE